MVWQVIGEPTNKIKSGALCRYAKASFFGEESEKTQYLDNTGRIAMHKFEPEWKSVMV